MSNGKNLQSGIKQFQNKNKHKFIKKWKNELKYQEEKDKIFISRDRGYNKSRILVIDSNVPNYDKDAGGRCTFLYLKLFKDLGLKVTFLANNFKNTEPYTTILQQNGIEVLYGYIYRNNIDKWLDKNLKYFQYIYLQRPDISIKYLDKILNNYNGKIVYFAHDLHHLRLFREYNITHKEKILKKSRKFETIEKKIFSNVDIIHVVGNYEYKILKDNYQNKTIRNIPLFFYEKQLSNIEKDFSKRENIIFVGRFSHPPNIDGVLWFSKEIYPQIVKSYPDIIWYIIGGDANNKIRQLQSKNIILIEHLSDKELQIMYEKCRIAIAPLRFGAGVKGKIVEAAYNQIPMVTTTIGGEGLDDSNEAFIMEDNPIKMSEIIVKLYINFTKLQKMSDSGKIFISKYFSKDIAKEIILKDIS